MIARSRSRITPRRNGLLSHRSASIMARAVREADAGIAERGFYARLASEEARKAVIDAKLLRVETIAAVQLLLSQSQTGLTDDDALILTKLAWDGGAKFGDATARYLQHLNA